MRRGPKPTKSKVEAKPPLARKSPKNDAEVRDLEKRLAEALEQQAAAADILRLIAESPSDLPAVLDGILGGAIRLMSAEWGAMARFDGELFHLVAQQGATPGFLETAARVYPFAPDPDSPSTKAITYRHPVYIEDAFEASYRGTRELARAGPFRSLLSLPLLREGRGIGTINLTWADVRPFPADRIEVLKTFANQAVIAIETVRLFKELEARNSDLSESLEQQIATGEILRVISQSPTDVRPVFDAIVRNAVQLCDAVQSGAFRFDGRLIHFEAEYHTSALADVEPRLEAFRRRFPMSPNREAIAARVILDCAVVHSGDIESDPDIPEASREVALAVGYRSILSVPMLRNGRPIGAISVARATRGHFSDHHVALLKTFADQAVIAIENVRLFTELQQKNEALPQAHAQVSEALEQQTATSEILRVISRSPTELQPVLAAVAESAARVCWADDATIRLVEGDALRLVTHYGPLPDLDEIIPRNRGSATGRAIADRRAVHIHDLAAESEGEFPVGRSLQRRFHHRTVLAVPLLREGIAIGGILIRRQEVRPFADRQITLLQTFADQAVIGHRECPAVQGAATEESGADRGTRTANGNERDTANHPTGAD